MLKTITLITILSAVGVFSVDSMAFADDFTVVFRISSKSSGGPAPPPDQKATEYHTDTKTRVTMGENFDRIEDSATGRVITIDHARKRYYDNSQQELLAAMQEKLEAQFRELEKLAKDAPELAAIKAMLAGKDASTVLVKRLPSTRMVAGYECKGTVYTITDAGTVTVWSTTALPGRQGNALNLSTNPVLGERFRKVSEEMRRSQEGFALSTEVTIELRGMRGGMLTEAVEVRHGIIPPSTFAPPAGYTKEDGLPPNPLGTPTAKPK
jgi:hypothetical protein